MREFTGERVIPGQVDADLLNEHLARYAFASRLARGKRVLDAGCGVGYGVARLARCAGRVVGLEIDPEAVAAARERYRSPAAGFVCADCRRLPFPDASFDLVTAFEVIEHLKDWERLLAESRRVLTPSGRLVVSTPNRLYYAEQRETPNPFHVHEFDHEEFRGALEEHFGQVRIFLENHANCIVFSTPEAGGAETVIESAESEAAGAHFFVAVCSASAAGVSPSFVYVPLAGNVLREREKHITLLSGWLEEAKQDLDQLHCRHQALEAEAAEDKRRAQEIIEALEEENARKTEWSLKSEAEVGRLQGIYEVLRGEFEKRTRWAVRLEQERGELEAEYQRLSEDERKVRLDLKTCVDQLHSTEADLEERTAWAQDLDGQLGVLGERVRRLAAELEAVRRSPAYRIGKRVGLAPEPGEGT